MFNVKIKVKEGSNNTLPRCNRSTSVLNGNNSYNGHSPATSSLRSSLASSNRSPNNSLKRKDKRVRIITTCMPTDEMEYQQQQQLCQCNSNISSSNSAYDNMVSIETRPISQLQQQQQTHERYIPPPLEILPEYQEQQQQQYPAANLHNYHANVFTTPGTVTTTGTSAAFQEPQHVGDVATASTNGVFENGKRNLKSVRKQTFNPERASVWEAFANEIN
ncbi:hypothetical protein EVAR_71449_1 [Eumeta japonica]|uniref:Uncharacterized protein n=1 Tax=Eumeta variegata TaxID=151549 RepID=A0A4C1TH53_EUMVA|nr:hypothetical protein EVAR_71449_1 [Eumeta japonica]